MGAKDANGEADVSRETTSEPVVQTVVLDLETSQLKNKKVRTGVDEFQKIAGYFSDIMPSIPVYERTRNNSAFYNLVKKEFGDSEIKSSVARDAAYHAISVWDSYVSNGRPGNRPVLGNGSYMYLCDQDIELVENDSGYGLKAAFIPYDSVWFGISTTPFSQEYLDRIFEDDAETAGCDFHISDDGTVSAHLSVKWSVDVYKADDVPTKVGVNLGEKNIFAAVAVTDGEVDGVEIQSGREFRHYRERLKDKRSRMMEKGDLRGLKKCRNEHDRYTKHTLDTASRAVVDFAVEHSPSVIVLEDLTNYRERTENPIHDWPFADLQEKIAYKATAEGIPVEVVSPDYVSQKCRKCGAVDEDFQHGRDFKCTECGYEVNVDVNAAINITRMFD